MAESAEPLAQFAFGDGLGQAAIAFAGQSAEDGAAESDGGNFLEQELIPGAEGAKFAGLIDFGLSFGEFLSEGDFDEAIFDAEMKEEVVDGLELLAKAFIFEVADDGGNEGAEIVLVGEEGGGRKGEGEGHFRL